MRQNFCSSSRLYYPVLLNGSEVWTLFGLEAATLEVFERKILLWNLRSSTCWQLFYPIKSYYVIFSTTSTWFKFWNCAWFVTSLGWKRMFWRSKYLIRDLGDIDQEDDPGGGEPRVEAPGSKCWGLPQIHHTTARMASKISKYLMIKRTMRINMPHMAFVYMPAHKVFMRTSNF